MPTYEMPLLIRKLTRPELVTTLKRTAEAIFSKGGFIRKIDHLGIQPMPYKISANNMTHREANFFVLHFDIPPATLVKLSEECNRDVDIVRCKIYNKFEPEEEQVECTLHEELLPPPYRPDVQQMLKIGEKQKARKEKYKFKFNTGLDYYPFQR